MPGARVQLAEKFEEQSNDLEKKFHGTLATLNTNVEGTTMFADVCS